MIRCQITRPKPSAHTRITWRAPKNDLPFIPNTKNDDRAPGCGHLSATGATNARITSPVSPYAADRAAAAIPANKMAPTWLPGPSIMTCPRRCPRARYPTTNDGNVLRTNGANVSARCCMLSHSLPKRARCPRAPTVCHYGGWFALSFHRFARANRLDHKTHCRNHFPSWTGSLGTGRAQR
jgi:hypothetical protein